MWPATVTTSVRAASARAQHDLLGEAVDEVRAIDVPADVEADERHAAPALDGHDLAEQDRRVLGQLVARLAARSSPRAGRGAGRGPRHRRRDRRLARPPRRCPESTADVDLGDPVPGGPQAGDRLDRRRGSAPSKPPRPSRQPARAGVEVERVDREVVSRGDGKRVVEPVQPDPELGRPVAGVLEVRVVAGADARVEPDADRRAGRTPPVALDLADGVEVEVDAVGEQEVEVALGDVRAGVADLVGQPAALEGAVTSPGEQASIPMLSGPPGVPRPGRSRGPRASGFALSAKRTRDGSRWGRTRRAAAGRSRRTACGRRRTGACRGRAPAPRRRWPTMRSRPSTDVEPGADPPGCVRSRSGGRCGWTCSPALAADAAHRGVHVRSLLDRDADRLHEMAEAAAISAIAASNASVLRADGFA